MRKIAFNLSEDSLTKAVEQMKAYKAEIHKKAQLLVERLTDYGLTICRAKVIEMDIPDTGHLLSQVDGYYSPLLNAGFIFCDCDYFVFVLYSTCMELSSQRHVFGVGNAIRQINL